MSKLIKALAAIISIVLIIAAWSMYTTVSARLHSRQKELLNEARELADVKIYDKSVASYRNALVISTVDNPSILYELASLYKKTESYKQYREVLTDLINDGVAPLEMSIADIYQEAAEYDLSVNETMTDILKLLKEGIDKTDSGELTALYEKYRYTLRDCSGGYEEASAIFAGLGLVCTNGLWGYVNAKGDGVIRPVYDMATNFSNYAAVQENNELYIIDKNGRRQAVADFIAADIAYFGGTSFSVNVVGSNDYVLASWQGAKEIYITKSDDGYQFIGMSTDGIRAVKMDDKWALSDRSGRGEQIPYEYKYEDIAVDEFGRCALNGGVFVEENGEYWLLNYAGQKIGGPFDGAKPFSQQENWAAVKKGDKWGFINSGGELVVEYKFEDAGSSSFGLAPVKVGELWGYISAEAPFVGNMVIEPLYHDAKQFVNGCAPVKLESGWKYVMLVEYD